MWKPVALIVSLVFANTKAANSKKRLRIKQITSTTVSVVVALPPTNLAAELMTGIRKNTPKPRENPNPRHGAGNLNVIFAQRDSKGLAQLLFESPYRRRRSWLRRVTRKLSCPLRLSGSWELVGLLKLAIALKLAAALKLLITLVTSRLIWLRHKSTP